MPTRKRRLWLQVSDEPVCRLYALWRRERDVPQSHGTEQAGLKSSAARVSAPLGDGITRKRRSAWWKGDS